MIGAEVDTTDKSHIAIHHDDLSVKTAKQVSTHTEQARFGVINMQVNASVYQLCYVVVVQIRCPIAVYRDVNTYLPSGSVK